jgi:dCMP deaminase
LRRQFGAVLIRSDRSIISTGYNGAPVGVKSCGNRGYCCRDKAEIKSGTHHEFCYAVHAEQNAILFAAKHGSPTLGATMYVTGKPCEICLKIIVQSGIKEVVYLADYPAVFEGYEEISSVITMRQFIPSGMTLG